MLGDQQLLERILQTVSSTELDLTPVLGRFFLQVFVSPNSFAFVLSGDKFRRDGYLSFWR
jgi:hypothetical protein